MKKGSRKRDKTNIKIVFIRPNGLHSRSYWIEIGSRMGCCNAELGEKVSLATYERLTHTLHTELKLLCAWYKQI